MKRILLAVALIALGAQSYAQNQTDKGWRSVGGTGRLYLDLDGSDGTYNNFSLAPEVYWFVANSFGLGTDFGFSMSTGKYDVNDSVTSRSQNVSMWITPGIRFYFREAEKTWRPYVFGNGGFGYSAFRTKYTGQPDNTGSSSGFRGYAGAGMAWFFSDHAAFDIRLNVIDYNIDNLYYNPDFRIGVQAFFD